MQDPLGADGRKTRQVVRPVEMAFGQPGAGGGHALRRPGKQRRLRLPDEPDGTGRPAERKVALDGPGALLATARRMAGRFRTRFKIQGRRRSLLLFLEAWFLNLES